MKITEVSVTSRRSVNYKSQYMTFECMLKANLEDKDDFDECVENLWDEAHSQVDKQIEDALEQM